MKTEKKKKISYYDVILSSILETGPSEHRMSLHNLWKHLCTFPRSGRRILGAAVSKSTAFHYQCQPCCIFFFLVTTKWSHPIEEQSIVDTDTSLPPTFGNLLSATVTASEPPAICWTLCKHSIRSEQKSMGIRFAGMRVFEGSGSQSGGLLGGARGCGEDEEKMQINDRIFPSIFITGSFLHSGFIGVRG